ncbi:unnamed protein product [Lepeophtheirus salmonis]|uniref:(salmon louse) hypothetical protein n=1 Tax=Lepeophtheirus salmonis TaxID=72036 RepID=A0A7R8D5H5_LEPSM|nr:unnamed protein product [Lepeophtheirus salmonis]CAF3035830.1 unnamed protein product [Lepeophtheirus salmonis]
MRNLDIQGSSVSIRIDAEDQRRQKHQPPPNVSGVVSQILDVDDVKETHVNNWQHKDIQNEENFHSWSLPKPVENLNESHKSLFELFMTDELIAHINKETNTYAAQNGNHTFRIEASPFTTLRPVNTSVTFISPVRKSVFGEFDEKEMWDGGCVARLQVDSSIPLDAKFICFVKEDLNFHERSPSLEDPFLYPAFFGVTYLYLSQEWTIDRVRNRQNDRYLNFGEIDETTRTFSTTNPPVSTFFVGYVASDCESAL